MSDPLPFNNSAGWIKLYYRFKEWEWYSDTNMVRLFIHLLLSANYRPLKWRGIEIPRGSLVVSRATLASETNLTEQEVRTCLKRLISTNEITTKSTNKFTIITICKFENYQSEQGEQNEAVNQHSNQQATNKQPTTNHQLTTSKEYKNIINIYLVVDNISREDFFQDFFSEARRDTIDRLCLSLGIDRSDMERHARDALAEWEAVGLPPHSDMREARQHLISHIRKKLDAFRRAEALKSKQSKFQNHDPNPQDRRSRFRAADSSVLKPEDYTGTI